MENSFQTSFIPKKPIIANSMNTSSSKFVGIPMMISIFILVVMIASTLGLFFYKSYLQKNKDTLSSSLLKIKESFDKDTIAELESYDKKSAAATQVLDGHIILSPLFEAINEFTLSSIQYTKFDHTTTNNVFSVKMSGIANDYKSIALQADVFGSKKADMFKDLIFSNLTKDKNNFVTFDVEFNIDPKILSYENNIINLKQKANSNLKKEADKLQNDDTKIDPNSMPLPKANETQ